ncbi:hypothetical protein [Actinoplanes subtropicus]|uniref:hypothetical protein n=1 Tax=Actinoplanes subtropicus TaxID=543632 RepID=UPI0012FB6DEA|nr:hypothetical protein [Actinoplanes subtropicus]
MNFRRTVIILPTLLVSCSITLSACESGSTPSTPAITASPQASKAEGPVVPPETPTFTQPPDQKSEGDPPADPPADLSGACTQGPSLMGSDAALECHPGSPEQVYYWHFSQSSEFVAAYRDLTSELGALSPVSGDCSELWNGKAEFSMDGKGIGFLACPDSPPSDVSYLYNDGSGGSFLTWANTSDETIGLVKDPYSLAAGLFKWWQSEYPQYVVS